MRVSLCVTVDDAMRRHPLPSSDSHHLSTSINHVASWTQNDTDSLEFNSADLGGMWMSRGSCTEWGDTARSTTRTLTHDTHTGSPLPYTAGSTHNTNSHWQ
jgi:hypothetical protein